MKRTDEDVDLFLESLQGAQGDDIRSLDRGIRNRMPGHARHIYRGKFWGGSDQSIIGYGVLDYENRSGDPVEWFIVGLAAQKNYISMYVNGSVDGRYLLRDYEDRLGNVKVGSASISFDSVDVVELDTLLDLVEEAGRIT